MSPGNRTHDIQRATQVLYALATDADNRANIKVLMAHDLSEPLLHLPISLIFLFIFLIKIYYLAILDKLTTLK